MVAIPQLCSVKAVPNSCTCVVYLVAVPKSGALNCLACTFAHTAQVRLENQSAWPRAVSMKTAAPLVQVLLVIRAVSLCKWWSVRSDHNKRRRSVQRMRRRRGRSSRLEAHAKFQRLTFSHRNDFRIGHGAVETFAPLPMACRTCSRQTMAHQTRLEFTTKQNLISLAAYVNGLNNPFDFACNTVSKLMS